MKIEINEKNKKIVTDFFLEAYNIKNYEYVMKYFSNDYIDHSPANARSNKQAVVILKIVHTMFPDIHVKIEDAIEEKDLVSVRVKFRGTQKGMFMNLEATNKTITWEALENFRLRDGIIIESWGFWPDLDMYKALGGVIR